MNKKGHQLEQMYVEANKLDKSGRASQIFLQDVITGRNKEGSMGIPRFGGFKDDDVVQRLDSEKSGGTVELKNRHSNLGQQQYQSIYSDDKDRQYKY